MIESAPLQNTENSTVFQTELGWMAIVTSARTICELSFANETAKAARAQIDRSSNVSVQPENEGLWDNAWIEQLVDRLRDYASGRAVAFDDFEVDTSAITNFGRRVISACREIPYGRTLTYGELAASAGSSGAARAVGNHMAKNRVPLIVPCHRVLPAGKGLGGYSAGGGVELKRRLLEMEAGNIQN